MTLLEENETNHGSPQKEHETYEKGGDVQRRAQIFLSLGVNETRCAMCSVAEERRRKYCKGVRAVHLLVHIETDLLDQIFDVVQVTALNKSKPVSCDNRTKWVEEVESIGRYLCEEVQNQALRRPNFKVLATDNFSGQQLPKRILRGIRNVTALYCSKTQSRPLPHPTAFPRDKPT